MVKETQMTNQNQRVQVPMTLVHELIGEKELALRLQQREIETLREETMRLASELEQLKGDTEKE
jgi:hypothetical protein